MDHPTLSTTDIIIPDRLRKNHGDIEDFAAGIAEVGHLIQPIVLNRRAEGSVVTFTLVAGGRRTKALELLGWPLRYGFEYVFKEDLAPDVALELELAENVERMEMSWQERCESIRRIHSLKVKLTAEEGTEDWGHAETGRLVGMQKSNVGIALQLAKALADPTDAEKLRWLNGAANFRDAISRLMKWKEDEGMKFLANQLIAKPSVPSDKSEPTIADEYDDLSGDNYFPEDEMLPGDTVETILKDAIAKSAEQVIPITNMLIHSKWEDYFSALADGSLDGHIITDPPYGIDMDNIQQQGGGMNIESVRAEHDVEDNLAMLRAFIPEAYRVLKNERFMVIFCDMEHFNTLLDIGVAAGFKATRWPIVWVKTHHCQNNCAQFNFTKATEDAIVFRKGNAILARPPQTNYFIGDNTATKSQHGGHPFVKPAALWTWIASHVALKGQTVIDPFMGEASCGEAVLPLGWNYLGIESNETHYSKAVVYITDYFSRIYHGKVKFI